MSIFQITMKSCLGARSGNRLMQEWRCVCRRTKVCVSASILKLCAAASSNVAPAAGGEQASSMRNLNWAAMDATSLFLRSRQSRKIVSMRLNRCRVPIGKWCHEFVPGKELENNLPISALVVRFDVSIVMIVWSLYSRCRLRG